MASLFFSLLLIFSLLSVSSAQTITKAAEFLSDSGHKSMSTALHLASDSFSSQPPSLTVIAPADASFPYSGQPSPNLLLYHLLPQTYDLQSLKSLPYSATIPTLLAGHSLTVTTLPADALVSLNNVTITATPIFDDGSLIVYGANRFFDPYFRLSGPIPSYGLKNLCCLEPRNPNPTAEMAARCPFSEVSKVLRSKGFSVMATFLEMQFRGVVKYATELTVFAPVDQAMMNRIGDLSQCSSLFRRHVAPCKLSWNDLVSLAEGTVVLRTNLQGFMINVSRDDGVLVLNGVSVIMPELYRSDWLVVHGVSEVLEFLPESPPEIVVASPPPEFDNSSGEEDDESPRTDEANEVVSPPEFGSGDLEEFEAGNGESTEMFANMTEEDEAAVSHRRFFVYRPQ